jgi:hypothetical protein
MANLVRSQPDLFLLLSLLSVILLNPLLDRGDVRRLILTGLTFVPVIFATIRLAQSKRWLWPSVLLMSITLTFGVISVFFPNPILLTIKWGSLALFFGLTVAGLFSYLTQSRLIGRGHLYTAASIYLILGMLWFALYSAIDTVYPGAFQRSANMAADRKSELLYFSLVTLSTIGYGDVLPIYGEVRMLAALEGVVGVLYVAITVAILVSSFKRSGDSSAE